MIYELSEDDIRILNQLDETHGIRVVDDGEGFWHIEDREGNIKGIGCSTPKSNTLVTNWWHDHWKPTQ